MFIVGFGTFNLFKDFISEYSMSDWIFEGDKMPSIIKTENLTKIYPNGVKAVDGVSFEVEEGEIFGFLGPNGAGKTTTILMLTTLTKPTKGSARICNYDIVKSPYEVRKCIGYVPQDLSVDDDLSGRENLELRAALYHVPRAEAEERIDELLELVDLKDSQHRLVDEYSGGMRKRLEIAEGLLHRPRVLFLDEPTLGLDLQTRKYIWDYISRLNREYKMTIFLTTHYMEEADLLCNRIAIIDFGKIVVFGTSLELKDRVGGDVIEVKFPESKPVTERLVRNMRKSRFAKKSIVSEDRLALNVFVDRGETAIPKITAIIANAGLVASSISLVRPSLDDVFLKYTGRRIRDEKGSWEEAMRMQRTIRRARAR